MEIYVPSSTSFPSISSSGTFCHLNCEHCKRHYLSNMVDASHNGIYYACRKAYENGASGALISGGSDSKGRVLIDYADLKKVAQIKNFSVNVHTGLTHDVPDVLHHVKCVSIDIPPSDAVVKNIYHLNKTQEDYFDMVELYEMSRIRYVPHMCIGIEGGKIKGEIDTLERLAAINNNMVVLLSLKRTPGIPFTFNKIMTKPYEKVIKEAREMFKYLCLGCMRDKSKDKEMLWHYFDKIAWPSSIIKAELARNESTITTYKTCCAV